MAKDGKQRNAFNNTSLQDYWEDGVFCSEGLNPSLRYPALSGLREVECFTVKDPRELIFSCPF
ncbi:hypothetical protein [Roseivirga seohaensis]|uniref:hypothetical protein n=1 Tax=Roseivirga seohaensis TaxID=1914963 RepID=UPI000A8FB308|nr:hypothetical protein [Roseivirga seohaensis]